MTTDRERRAVFRNSPLFEGLNDRDLDQLLALGGSRRFAKEQVVFLRESQPDALYAVLTGQVRAVTNSLSGSELILRLIDPGEVFGEVGLLDGSPRTATTIASADSELFVIEGKRFRAFLSARPGLCLQLLAALARRLRSTSQQLEDVQFREVPARLARKLLELAESYGRSTPDGTRIERPLPQQVLGNLIGASRVSVNQTLRAWAADGLVEVGRSRLTLLDLDRLQDVADELDDG